MTDTTYMGANKTHHGRNVAVFRNSKRWTQDGLAKMLGEPYTQRKISELEMKETIDADILEKIAPVLGISKEVLENFEADAVSHNYTNNFHDNSTNQGPIGANTANTINFNVIDKLVDLYERLLAAEREKIDILKGSKK